MKLLTCGVVGMSSTGVGLAISLSSFEGWLRISSLIIGIVVGLATLVAIVHNWKKNK